MESKEILTLAEVEKTHIETTLSALGFNKTQTAKALGISLKTLYNKLEQYGEVGSVDLNVSDKESQK